MRRLLRSCLYARWALATLLASCALALPHGAWAGDSEDAAAVVTRLQSGLLRLDRENAKRTNAQRYEAFGPLITATHDLSFMAQVAISAPESKLFNALR